MTYFQFNLRQFVHLLAEEILSYSSAVMFLALAIETIVVSDYNMPHSL